MGQAEALEPQTQSLFEVARSLARAVDALTELHSLYQPNQGLEDTGFVMLDAKIETGKKWNRAANEFDQSSLLAELTCGDALNGALTDSVYSSGRLLRAS